MRNRQGSLAAVCLVLLLAACVRARATPGFAGGKLVVVAAEDVWGNLAGQLAGGRASVRSIITNPNADPHDYEPTAEDARALAGAGVVILNGIGYDAWVDRLLAANPVAGRQVVNVGDLLGVPAGGNPHQWYAPASVARVLHAISAAYARRDPSGAGAYEAQERLLETQGFARYHALIEEIRSRFAGTPIGASESIFAEMAPALGLDLVTPPSFLTAISEGTEPTPSDKATIDDQIRSGLIRVYVENAQNTTPDVVRQVAECRAAGIPVATITETITPEGASFQDWQSRQLTALLSALEAAP